MGDDEAEGAQDFEGGEDDVLEVVLGGVDACQEQVWLPQFEAGNVFGGGGIGLLDRSEQSFRFCQIAFTGCLECLLQIFQQRVPLRTHLLRRLLILPTYDARALKAPILQLPLRFLPRAARFWDCVPEAYFAVGWNVPRGTHDDHVSDEAAASVGVTAVVDVRSFDEDAGSVVGFFPLLMLGRVGIEVDFQGGPGAAEDVEGDDSLDEEAGGFC